MISKAGSDGARKEKFHFGTFLILKEYFFLPFSESSHEQAKLHWVVRLRWLVIAFLITLAPFGIVTGVLNGNASWIYVALLIMLFCFNIGTQFRWFERKKEVGIGHITFQLFVDLIVLTAFLTLTDGGLNPFYVLFYINVSLGATLLDGKWGLIFLVLCHIALLIVQAVSYLPRNDSQLLPAYVIQHLVLLIAWGVSRSLGRYISIQKERLHHVKLYAEKIDRLRALGAMTAGFSHEFASPLNTVKLRLERELRANPQSENLQEMNMAVLECESVIRQMNGAQMDPRDFKFQVFNLSVATKNILKSWLYENPEARAEFDSDNQSRHVKLPVLNYSQSLINILDNAFEANPYGAIRLAVEQNESKIVLSVENEGSSFSTDVLQRFGEPFVTTKSTGTGLGLYSVQLFAQSSGGRAIILNTGVGARVELHFPHSFDGELQ
jgi:two-component system sensor histidine kinase RegB